MRKLAHACVATLLIAWPVYAKYQRPGFDTMVQRATHIVHAKVTDITKEGFAVLALQHEIKGDTPATTIKDTTISCTGGPPSAFGVQAGRDYILFLDGSNLLEEHSFYEVVRGRHNALGMELSEKERDRIGARGTWVYLYDFLQLIKSHLPETEIPNHADAPNRSPAADSR